MAYRCTKCYNHKHYVVAFKLVTKTFERGVITVYQASCLKLWFLTSVMWGTSLPSLLARNSSTSKL